MIESIDDLFSCFNEVAEISVEKTKEHRADTTKFFQNLSENGIKGTKREHDFDESSNKKNRVDNDLYVDEMNFDEYKNRIIVQPIESLECTHEVCYPLGSPYVPLKPRVGKPAKTYQFTLDPFQSESILCIENNQSVLVSAHTSAGKTVVAEYAVATCLKNKQRVIYTTPIKALSNQKYREFNDEFKDVGLVTGDVTINPTASCLIMTTEILRNMLYRGSEIMREVAWVVFDEIHYMRNKARGVVWEETLILLPHNVHYVFLSATIPNARQFAEWVAHIHQQSCHVIYTEFRPTPLQHYVFPSGGNGIHLAVDENGTFKDENFNKAMVDLQNVGEAGKGDEKGRRGGISMKDPAQTDIYKMIQMIMKEDFAPVILFSFSKRDCELYATQMTKMDLNSYEEKEKVEEIFQNAIAVLNEDDRQLPQIDQLLPLLRRGIGIHHGGLLPILKETIEILFGEGLLKTLFATETFAMGLNMPARTVVFTGTKKFDGAEFRYISSGEYIQMSGRAGRRGLDTKGIVILMVNQKVPPGIGREILKGLPDSINSAFHLTYNMVLNLMRVEEINPEYMLERSFYQYQNQAMIPGLYNEYNEVLEKYENLSITDEHNLASYYNINEEFVGLLAQYRSYITKPKYLHRFLQAGRIVKIQNHEDEYDWGIVISYKVTGKTDPAKPEKKLMANILLHVASEPQGSDLPKPCPSNEEGEVRLVTINTAIITHISSVRLNCPANLDSKESQRMLFRLIKKVKERFRDGLPLLDPIKEMKVEGEEFEDLTKKVNILERKLHNHPLHKEPNLKSLYAEYKHKMQLTEQVREAKRKLMKAKAILQLDELKCRKRVLRRLGFCTNTDVILLKGRVACELSSADELLLTEMIFNGVFGSLSAQQACALLSCFVCDEKGSELPKLTEELSGPLRQMQDLARRIAKVSKEARLSLEEEAYVERFKPFLMDVVFAWCNGSKFADLCRMTDIFEGSIIRCMRRLEELLRQMVQAAKTIGNTDLEDKFNTAIKQIKRDIIFAASLYL